MEVRRAHTPLSSPTSIPPGLGGSELLQHALGALLLELLDDPVDLGMDLVDESVEGSTLPLTQVDPDRDVV